MRKGVIFTIKGCFRSVCNHPFLVCLLSVLIFMYRSSPFMFSLLVSASPVLVCTAVLLGTILFFGQPNIPEIEIKEKTNHDVVPQKTELWKDAMFENNESYYVQRYSETKRDESEQPTVGSTLSERRLDEVCSEGSVDVAATFYEKRSQGTELVEVLETNRDLDDKIEKQKSDWDDGTLSDGEVMEYNYASIRKVIDPESEYEISEADSYDSEMVNADALESPARSSWNQVDQQEEEEDDALDSGSDQAESSSPDASMADMMPMLDELHPLLDEEAPQPVQMSHVGSEAASEQSPRSITSSIESVNETENQEDSEIAEDGEDDDDDDAQGYKEDQAKSAITWTEEDQKNLMDVGSSEIERNQRLEHLILRRRSRKNMSMVPEINLIDLESSDFPIHIAPISTTRQNPFDLPQDSYDNPGLPPIPGSAPSILLPRRNPFDIPYDSSKEKQNLMGDGSQEELKALQSREPFFRRRDSFNVGPSAFAPNRQEMQDLKWRPYFIPERMVLEEPSYSTLQRQSSEISDSKVSSVPDTESISSVEGVEEQKLEEEEEDPQKLEVVSRTEEVIEECPLGDQDQISNREFSEEDDVSVFEDVGHGSQSSEEEYLELGSVEKRVTDVNDLKFQSGDVEDHYGEGTVAQNGYNYSSLEAVEQRQSRGSTTPSLSEVTERISTEINGKGSSMLDGRSHDVAVEPDTSRQTSDLSITSTSVDNVPHKEPVYDSSPPAVGTVRANDDINSDISGVDQRSDENFTDEKLRGDCNLGELEEDNHFSISERESPISVGAARVEGQLKVDYSIDAEETVLSPNSDADYHEACEKISTPSVGGNTSHFYVRAMHELDFEHLEEVQVPNTPVQPSEKALGILNIHIPELHELNRDVSPNTKSSVIPNSLSKPSSTSEGAIAQVDTQTISDDADEIKEIHEVYCQK